MRLLTEGMLLEARAADAAARRGCGYDFNQIILLHHFDGQEHPYRCPQCGVEGTFRSPLFEEENA